MEKLSRLELMMWVVVVFQVMVALGLVGLIIWMLFNV